MLNKNNQFMRQGLYLLCQERLNRLLVCGFNHDTWDNLTKQSRHAVIKQLFQAKST